AGSDRSRPATRPGESSPSRSFRHLPQFCVSLPNMRSFCQAETIFRSSSYNPTMSPLRGSTLGVVGAGVMAKAIIAGVLEPQVMPAVLQELRASLAPEKLVISIIAGATTATLRSGLDHGALVRVMPNTPAQIGEGVNIWYATPEATDAHREQARALLGALGH